MNRIEANDGTLYCPFCGKEIITPEDGPSPNPCEHTLFIICDEGPEYCSEKIDLSKKDPGVNWDDFTDGLDYPNSIKVAAYQPAPSFFGVYVGLSSNL